MEKYCDKVFWIHHNEEGYGGYDFDEYINGICENRSINWSIDLLWHFNKKIYPENLLSNKSIYKELFEEYIDLEFIDDFMNEI